MESKKLKQQMFKTKESRDKEQKEEAEDKNGKCQFGTTLVLRNKKKEKKKALQCTQYSIKQKLWTTHVQYLCSVKRNTNCFLILHFNESAENKRERLARNVRF